MLDKQIPSTKKVSTNLVKVMALKTLHFTVYVQLYSFWKYILTLWLYFLITKYKSRITETFPTFLPIRNNNSSVKASTDEFYN